MKVHDEIFTSLHGKTAEPGQLYFDIESTGLSPKYASVYLIGCAWAESMDQWHLRLYFADSRNAEVDVLRAFEDLVSEFDTVVHFNGDRFDIPFLQERYKKHLMADPFVGKKSIDLLKLVRPYKNLLGLENLKQKTLERFLGVDREDEFNGGQLIQVYDEYLYTDNPKLEHFLLLHNLEDVKGMSSLVALLDIPEWLNGEFDLIDAETISCTDFEFCDDYGCSRDAIKLNFYTKTVFPGRVTLPHRPTVTNKYEKFESHEMIEGLPFVTPDDDASNIGSSHAPAEYPLVEVDGNRTSITLPAFAGKIRHYYKNTKCYYFIPDEGMAVHKSVSEFLDKSKRVRATKDNCFGLCAPSVLTDINNATEFMQTWINRLLKAK